MHIVVGLISAVYSGRSDTQLPPYDRLVIQKSDGTVSIHSDKGFKPLNYMASASKKTESENSAGERIWVFETSKERLEVTLHKVFSELNLDLGELDPGHSSKDGTEVQLQGWLYKNLATLNPGLKVTGREYQTGAGPVDLIGEFEDGAIAAIEVKRSAAMPTVGQVLRYADSLEELNPNRRVVAMIAAVEFKDSTRVNAKKKGVICVDVPPTWFTMDAHGEEVVAPPPARTLFG